MVRLKVNGADSQFVVERYPWEGEVFQEIADAEREIAIRSKLRGFRGYIDTVLRDGFREGLPLIPQYYTVDWESPPRAAGIS